jgi:hypothetical protein
MKYSLRSLLIVAAVMPPLLALPHFAEEWRQLFISTSGPGTMDDRLRISSNNMSGSRT